MMDIVEMFDGNVKGVYGNHTCFSLQTSINEDDENLTTAHHRHLRESYLDSRTPQLHLCQRCTSRHTSSAKPITLSKLTTSTSHEKFG